LNCFWRIIGIILFLYGIGNSQFQANGIFGELNKGKYNTGFQLIETNDYSRFYPVLADNLKDRHGVRPTHTLEELKRLEELLGSEKIRQFTTVDESGEVLAGMIMFHANTRVTLAFYISHNEKHQSRRPVNLVYREVIEWARQMGYSHLDLGTFTLNGEVNHGLCRFKESFTARGRFRNTFVGKV